MKHSDGKTIASAIKPWPRKPPYLGVIDLYMLPPEGKINGAFINDLTGLDNFPADAPISLRVMRAEVGNRRFNVGFCLGDGEHFSAIGLAVIERLMIAAPDSTLHVAHLVHGDIAWDKVLDHLRSFSGETLLFSFPNSEIYDAGTVEMWSAQEVRVFDTDGQLQKLTRSQRREIKKKAAKLQNRPAPTLFPAPGVDRDEAPWIFRFATPSGKSMRVAVWNGRRDYAHAPPDDIHRWVGGDKIAFVQVDSPVGVDRRSSIGLTHKLSDRFDSVIHWARDTETFQSIINSFVNLNFQSSPPPDIPADWEPEIVIFPANAHDKKAIG